MQEVPGSILSQEAGLRKAIRSDTLERTESQVGNTRLDGQTAQPYTGQQHRFIRSIQHDIVYCVPQCAPFVCPVFI